MGFKEFLLRLLQPLIDKLKEALGPFGKIFAIVNKFWTRLTSLRQNVQKLVDTILGEIRAWKGFKEDIAFRTRVINLPKAIDKTKEFIDQLRSAWDAVIELWTDLKGKLEFGGNPTEEAEAAIKDLEASGFKDILSKFPRLLKGAEKVLGFVAIVADALSSILAAIDDLQRIADAVKALREEIETGSTVFLNNRNPRKTIKLADGGSMKIRVGNLHS